jgi:hypothetical protein
MSCHGPCAPGWMKRSRVRRDRLCAVVRSALDFPLFDRRPVEAETHPAYICQMPETFKCPHCGAVYEVTYEKTVSPDKDAANCQVCGKQMVSTNASSIPHYELVKMPDGTNV